MSMTSSWRCALAPTAHRPTSPHAASAVTATRHGPTLCRVYGLNEELDMRIKGQIVPLREINMRFSEYWRRPED